MDELHDDVSGDTGFCVYLETPVTGVGQLGQEDVGSNGAKIL